MTTTLLHLSDPHLDGSAEREGRLRSVLRLLPASRQPDAVVITGDLTDHGSAEEYDQLGRVLQTELASLPWLVVPGNHDDPATMASRLDVDPEVSSIDVDGLRLIGLDVTVPDHDHGLLRAEVAEAVVECAGGADRVVLAFHQPPIEIGHGYIDPMRLLNDDAVARLIERVGVVDAVLCGHAHTPYAGTLAGVAVRGAPGIVSALGLDPDREPLTSADGPPGLALHRFDAGAATTGAPITSVHYAI